MLFSIGQHVAMIGPAAWGCVVEHVITVPHGGCGPLYPMGDYWRRGVWYLLRRMFLINSDLAPYEQDAAISDHKVYEAKLLDYRRATADDLLTMQRFQRVWVHETHVVPLHNPTDKPSQCLVSCSREFACQEDSDLFGGI